ncbi:BpuSI family type II restriction endonuclease [Sporosarcina sp. P33]|uniref:BpuSI family type II restriction endonuclease n=1 Tax=Sporosarcina sp. P33 TaxID=1930764 RepID=UPI0009C06F79|nr:BpuSI family type II restriction endonuclease [Sporosarcina sp. P33]ARD47514.1 hypothetical protein SporoP33_04190 [Sporosarcina sp. P33]
MVNKTCSVLPVYTDSEVTVFHPLCEKALNDALLQLKLDSTYTVKHHEYIGSLEADFVIQNKVTKKYLIFIEVKRTKASLTSTRYRKQAQSYVTEASVRAEKPYYCLTNLEVIEIFKHDDSRPIVSQQLLEPGPILVGDFSDMPQNFYDNLVKSFMDVINMAFKDSGKYILSTSRLYSMLDTRKNNLDSWHQTLMVTGYEYIRGALKGQNVKNSSKDAVYFQNRPDKLMAEGKKIDFKDLFSSPFPNSADKDLWDVNFLSELNSLGEKTLTGDELAELIHSVAIKGKEHDGIVPTDIELGKVLSILSHHILDRELKSNETICDPAAGSGNLLATTSSAFPNIGPSQLWANDIEPFFIELLSIRLGLLFPHEISPSNATLITSKDICELNPNDFKDVKIVVLNPPYLSGVMSSLRKKKFSEKIKDINGKESSTSIGQVGIEAPFLELVINLISAGTVVSAIMPKQYLTSKGPEAVAFREFLITEFGLKHIFQYPREGIFKEVTKDTVIFIGQKGSSVSTIEVLNSVIKLEQIDLNTLKESLIKVKGNSNLNTPIDMGMGLELSIIDTNNFRASIPSGWSFLTPSRKNADDWVNNNLSNMCLRLSNLNYDIKRGRVGNQGASDLIFINSKADFWRKVESLIPASWMCPALRRITNINHPIINSNNTDLHFLCPPSTAFLDNTRDSMLLNQILDEYIDFQEYVTKQKKTNKSKDDLIKLLLSEIRYSSKPDTILIPRAIRRSAKAFIASNEIYCSTNVISVNTLNKSESLLLLSWLTSIFAQLHFETMAKDQEGARKLEALNIKDLYVPDFSQIPNSIKNELLKEAKVISFFDLRNPEIRKVDKLWAEFLWGNAAKDKAEEACIILEDIVYERQP